MFKLLSFFSTRIDKKFFIYLISLVFLVNILDALSLSLFIPILDKFQENTTEGNSLILFLTKIIHMLGFKDTLKTFLLLLSIIFFVKTIFSFLVRYLAAKQASKIQHDLRMKMMEGYMHSTIDFINRHKQGFLLASINEYINRTSNIYFLSIQIIAHLFTVLVIFSFLAYVSWELTIISTLLGLCIIPLLKFVGKKTYFFGEIYSQNFEKSTHTSHEMLQAKKQITAMRMQPDVLAKFKNISQNVYKSWLWMVFFSNSPAQFVQPIAVIVLSLVILFGASYGLSMALTGAFVMAFIRLIPPFQSSLAMINDIKAAIPSYERIERLMKESMMNREIGGTLDYNGIRKYISFKKISFSFNDNVILKNTSFTINKGEMVAFLGESGSGKTTLIDIILGIRQPDSGEVIIDGNSLVDLNIDQFRKKIAYVPQETILFNDTFYNNLTIGLNDYIDYKEVESICKMVGAWSFINKRENKLDSQIGDLGVNLSGGQRQRLALARALLRNPELLILDEATSALDKESEILIKNALSNIRSVREISIIIIAHRYTTIRDADMIFQLSGNKISKLGPGNKSNLGDIKLSN